MRALTLGELILVNILRELEKVGDYSPEELKRAIRLGQYRPPLITGLKMPRVGFKGLKAYHQSALGELDSQADALAERIDDAKARGLGAIAKHSAALNKMDIEIAEMEEMVREGSNGAP